LYDAIGYFTDFRLDQGLTDIYTCPTCRKPLFEGVPQNEASSDAGTISSDEQLARQISAGLDRPNPSRHTMPTGLYPNQTLNTPEGVTWRFNLHTQCYMTFCLSFEFNCYLSVKFFYFEKLLITTEVI